jgi:hypothetical protein
MLGRAKKVMIDKENTTIVGGAGNEEFRLRGYLSRHSRSAFSTTSLLGSTRGKYSPSPVCKPTRIEK